MRGRTVIFAALALLFAIVAIIYGAMDGPPAPNQAADPGRLNSQAPTPSTASRDQLPPNVRNEAPGEPAGGTTGSASDTSQPGAGTAPQTGRR